MQQSTAGAQTGLARARAAIFRRKVKALESFLRHRAYASLAEPPEAYRPASAGTDASGSTTPRAPKPDGYFVPPLIRRVDGEERIEREALERFGLFPFEVDDAHWSGWKAALAALRDSREITVVTLWLLTGYTRQEVAEHLGVSETTVTALRDRALRSMVERIEAARAEQRAA